MQIIQNTNVYTIAMIRHPVSSMDGKNTNSHTKARIIYDLMVSPRLRSDIVLKYSKQSSKGIYRHLRDLESDKIIREVRAKGAKPLLVLNKDNLSGISKALSYLMDRDPKIAHCLDMAFVECAISAYGDYPTINPFSLTSDAEIPNITLHALIAKKRPDIDDELLSDVMESVKERRGELTVKDKIFYITMVNGLSHSDWSRDEMSPMSLSMSFLFGTNEPAIKNKDGKRHFGWYLAVQRVILMAQGERKHFMDEVTFKEIDLMMARLTVHGGLLLPISEIERTSLNVNPDENPSKKNRLNPFK